MVRGRLDSEREQQLRAFWERTAGFAGPAADARLQEMVCLLRADGEVVGASSVFAAEIALIAGRRFWVFRCLVEEGFEDRHGELVSATFHALDAESTGAVGAPIGLCVLLDAKLRRARPEAEWRDPRLVYAGYLADGRQVRVAYFSDQVSSMSAPMPEGGWQPEPGYRILRFAEQSDIGAEDVTGAWVEEGGLTAAQAERRLPEVLSVAVGPDGRLAGITTAFLARNEQVRADMWHFRGLVLAAHRNSRIGLAQSVAGRDWLTERYVSGQDRRGLGIVYEVENEGLKRHFPHGIWYETDFILIGENRHGAHVRVHYFPGALAPEPVPRQA